MPVVRHRRRPAGPPAQRRGAARRRRSGGCGRRWRPRRRCASTASTGSSPPAAPAPVRSSSRSARRTRLAVYPAVEGSSFGWGPFEDAAHRDAVLDRLVELHGVDGCRDAAGTDDLGGALVAGLRALLADPGERWDAGPFGPDAWRLVVERGDVLRRPPRPLPRTWSPTSTPRGWVLTHGEPHRANTVRHGHRRRARRLGHLPARPARARPVDAGGGGPRHPRAPTPHAPEPPSTRGCSRRSGCAGTSPTSSRAFACCGRRTRLTRTPAPPGPPCAGCSRPTRCPESDRSQPKG